jgi:hypothetical protein
LKADRFQGNKMICKVAGAIIHALDKKIIGVYRLKEPKGLALPSFHLSGQFNREVALQKNPTLVLKTIGELFCELLKKEFNIEARFIRRHNVIPVAHRCSYQTATNLRDAPPEMHDWIVFEVLKWTSEPKNLNPEKYRSLEYLTPEEILQAVANKQFDPVWSVIIPQIRPLTK